MLPQYVTTLKLTVQTVTLSSFGNQTKPALMYIVFGPARTLSAHSILTNILPSTLMTNQSQTFL